jgi:hypothetical protein
MQNLVANTVLRRVTDVATAQIITVIMPEKSNVKEVDSFAIFLESALTLFILLMYVPVLFRSVYRIVFEKVSKTKESMRIMGMTDFPYWLSWFTSFSIINLVMVTACWAILMINIISWKSSFFLFAIIWIYGQSLFGLVLITQSLFSTPRAAGITTTIVYFGMTLFFLLVDDPETARTTKWGLCWFFPTISMC